VDLARFKEPAEHSKPKDFLHFRVATALYSLVYRLAIVDGLKL